MTEVISSGSEDEKMADVEKMTDVASEKDTTQHLTIKVTSVSDSGSDSEEPTPEEIEQFKIQNLKDELHEYKRRCIMASSR